MYKSTDAGKTWTHLGLRDTPADSARSKSIRRIPIACSSRRSAIPTAATSERGIFRSTDGGESFEQVLYRDENTGGKDVDIDPSNPDIVYATMFEGRQGPWENGAWRGSARHLQVDRRRDDVEGADERTARSHRQRGAGDRAEQPEADLRVCDGGTPPPQAQPVFPRPGCRGGRGAGAGRGGRGGRGGTGPANNPIYRSDDAGETWTALSNDPRVGTSNEASIAVDPKNPDWLIVTSQVTYKSEDGGKTWVPFKGAPGGDDYQYAWINPNNTDIMILAVDQGAVVSLDKGKSWSSWYNQPTAAMYHIADRQRLPVSRLRRTAGQRVGVRREPRQRRRDHDARVASGGDRGIRLRRARPARSRHRLRHARK